MQSQSTRFHQEPFSWRGNSTFFVLCLFFSCVNPIVPREQTLLTTLKLWERKSQFMRAVTKVYPRVSKSKQDKYRKGTFNSPQGALRGWCPTRREGSLYKHVLVCVHFSPGRSSPRNSPGNCCGMSTRQASFGERSPILSLHPSFECFRSSGYLRGHDRHRAFRCPRGRDRRVSGHSRTFLSSPTGSPTPPIAAGFYGVIARTYL